MKTTPQNITKLKKNEVFVFGSNDRGEHIGGAAKIAVEKFGAQMGNPEGLQGQAFAIITMSGIEPIKQGIELLITATKLYPKKQVIR